MDFDLDMVHHALAQAGGNEQLAINLILNGEVHDAAIGSTSAAVTSPDAALFKSSIAVSYTDHFMRKRVPFSFDADGNPFTPSEQRAQIKRPLEMIKAAAWFFARRSPGNKRHRDEPPPPLGHMLAEFPPCVPASVMLGCVATACCRLATAPAGMHVMYRTARRWTGWIMERVTRGGVSRVQVRLQRRA